MRGIKRAKYGDFSGHGSFWRSKMTAGAREPENPLDLNFKISFRFHFGIDELGEFLFFASN